MRLLAVWFIAITFITGNMSACAADKNNPYEGMYEVVAKPNKIFENKLEVTEIFLYTCPHCSDFEPIISKWVKERKPADVEFVKMPAPFNNSLIPITQAFFVAEQLNAVDKIHMPLFDAVQKQRRKDFLVLREQQDSSQAQHALKVFFKEHGISEEDFDNYYVSFEVDSKMRKATKLISDYEIKAVPTIVVNGKYRISSNVSRSKQFEVVEYLLEKERQAMAK